MQSQCLLFIYLSVFYGSVFYSTSCLCGWVLIRNKVIYIDISSKSYRNGMKLSHAFLSSPLLPSPNNRNFWQLFGPIVSPMQEEFWILAKAMIRYNLVFYFSLPAKLFLQQIEENFLSYHEPKPCYVSADTTLASVLSPDFLLACCQDQQFRLFFFLTGGCFTFPCLLLWSLATLVDSKFLGVQVVNCFWLLLWWITHPIRIIPKSHESLHEKNHTQNKLEGP